MSINANNSAFNEFANYNALLDSIPTTLPLPTAADYAITSTQNDNFSVSFHLSGITSYGTEWSAGKVLLNILANPDSTTLHPLSLLTALKSRKLQGQSLAGLKLTNFDFQTVQGLNYNGYFNLVYDSTGTGPFPNNLAYFKDLE